MAILKKNAFSRRVPDLVTEELVAVLSRRASFEFKQLFDIVHENLRARNAASGGEEMLRLRAYEKLQNLVARGAVKKNGKKYKGLPSALAAAIAPQNGHFPGSAAPGARRALVRLGPDRNRFAEEGYDSRIIFRFCCKSSLQRFRGFRADRERDSGQSRQAQRGEGHAPTNAE